MTGVVALGGLVEIRGGGTPSRNVPEYWGGDIPWATVKDFTSTYIDSTLERITAEGVANSATNVIPAGAIIVPTRMAVGKAAINKIALAINQDLKALIPGKDVDAKFLMYFLLSQAPYLERRAQGATVKGIKLDLLQSLEFPRLAVEEQRRIATILDKAEDIRRRRDQFNQQADDFLRSAFVHLVGFKNPQHQKWKLLKVEDLAMPRKGSMRTGPFGSDLRHSEFVDAGIAVLGIDNAVQNRFAWGERRYISEEKFEKLRRYEVHPGDVIITIMEYDREVSGCAG
ncbi:restriction endonuclease subunit S [Methylocystis sp. IM4]|uniref:restriction endonuclease subunit S n=1 Tax=Methylocystis sp. IM4 TaxID=3136560 RepID=UPI0031194E25